MTTEEDFQSMLDSDPTDQFTRLVLADFLQEQGDPRAEGYRELARRGLWPYVHSSLDQIDGPPDPSRVYWGSSPTKGYEHALLGPEWWGATIEPVVRVGVHGQWKLFPGRRVAEDAAAIAWLVASAGAAPQPENR